MGSQRPLVEEKDCSDSDSDVRVRLLECSGAVVIVTVRVSEVRVGCDCQNVVGL